METDRFRAWLARRLLGTSYATIRIADSEIDGIAKRLGIDPDLLLEVRAKALLDLHERGLARPLSNRHEARAQAERALYQLKVWTPRDVRDAWNEECVRRGVQGPTLLRSVIHAYLLGGREPDPAPSWVLRGRLVPDDRSTKLDERAVISHGAKHALMRRAAVRNTKSMRIVRALMMEVLRGEHMGVPLVSAGMMFEDETRYNLGDSVRP